jgi:hypothetical protein
LVGEEVILVGDQQDGGKKRQISTPVNKGNNKITELRAILQRESQNS